MKPKISMIAAIGATTRAIGKNNQLLWKIPEDLKHFKQLTSGHPVIMGRKTFDSIGKPLPNRLNIIVTRDTSWQHEGVEVAHSLESALTKAKETEGEELFVIGGAELYAQALPYADRLYLTLVKDDASGDAFFPLYQNLFRNIIRQEAGSSGDIQYSLQVLEK